MKSTVSISQRWEGRIIEISLSTEDSEALQGSSLGVVLTPENSEWEGEEELRRLESSPEFETTGMQPQAIARISLS